MAITRGVSNEKCSTHSYTQPHNLYQWEYLHEEKSALKVARSLLSLYSWLVGCIKIVMRICRQANHHAVDYWRLLAVVVILWVGRIW